MKTTVIQTNLFDLIQKSPLAKYALVDEISDTLGISRDSAYRRIRGDMLLDINETVQLCQHYKISMDSLMGVSIKNQIKCNYSPLDLSNLPQYMVYVQNLSANIERVRSISGSEMLLSASDISTFNLLAYKELTFFKLFAWNKNVYGFKDSYEEFVKKLDVDEIVKYYDKIVRDYQLIPSTEVWTANSIDPLLRLLSYHSEIESFSDTKYPLFLCEQALNLMDTLQEWTEKGTKGARETPFKLFISETDLEGTFVILKYQEKTQCMFKLYTINSINTDDERFCQETERWLRKTAQRSTLISGASEKERRKFFTAQRQKIRLLMGSI